MQVSDIYGQDEIEALLLDLNKLEFAKFDTDFDTFDIDGSRIEGLDEVGDSGPTSPLLPRPTSPGGLSSKSWNSHTHYHQFKEPPDDYVTTYDFHCGDWQPMTIPKTVPTLMRGNL